MTLDTQIREALRAARDRTGRSQRELAAALTEQTGEAWSQTRVWHLFSGRRAVTVEDLVAAAHVLGVDLSSLMPVIPPASGSIVKLPDAAARIVETIRQDNVPPSIVVVVFPEDRVLRGPRRRRRRAKGLNGDAPKAR